MPQVLRTFCKVLSLAFCKVIFFFTCLNVSQLLSFCLSLYAASAMNSFLYIHQQSFQCVSAKPQLHVFIYSLPHTSGDADLLFLYFVPQRLCAVTDLPGKSCIVFAVYEAVNSILELVQIIPVFFLTTKANRIYHIKNRVPCKNQAINNIFPIISECLLQTVHISPEVFVSANDEESWNGREVLDMVFA